MPTVPAVNTAQVQLVFTQDYQTVENVYHVQQGSAWTTSTLNSLCNAFQSWWDTNLKAHVAANVGLYKIIAVDLTTATSPGVEVGISPPLMGTNTSTPLPNNVSVAIQWATGLRGRSFRGRTFHVGLCDVHVLQNNLTSSALGIFQTAYNTLVSDIHAFSTYNLVVSSTIHNGAPRSTAVLTPIIEALFADGVVDSQRRRLPTRGT